MQVEVLTSRFHRLILQVQHFHLHCHTVLVCLHACTKSLRPPCFTSSVNTSLCKAKYNMCARMFRSVHEGVQICKPSVALSARFEPMLASQGNQIAGCWVPMPDDQRGSSLMLARICGRKCALRAHHSQDAANSIQCQRCKVREAEPSGGLFAAGWDASPALDDAFELRTMHRIEAAAGNLYKKPGTGMLPRAKLDQVYTHATI